MKKNYHESKLGKVPDLVKKVKLSERTKNILSGKYDDGPLSPETQPILYKMNLKIKAKSMINWAELSRTLAGDRSAITKDRIPQKHSDNIDELIDSVASWLQKIQKDL